MQTKTSVQSAQAIEVVRLIDGWERDKGSSPFAVNVIAVDVGIIVILGVLPPLVIRAAPFVVVVIGKEQDVKDSSAKAAGDERVAVTLAGGYRHVTFSADMTNVSPPPPAPRRASHPWDSSSDARAGREGAPLAACCRRRGMRTRGSIVFLDPFEGRTQRQWRTPCIPAVAIIVINDGIAIDVHPIKITINIQLLQLPGYLKSDIFCGISWNVLECRTAKCDQVGFLLGSKCDK
jgi:hypothetical protein